MDKPKLIANNEKDLKVKPKSDVLSQREAVYIEVMRVVREDKIVVNNKQAVKGLLNESHLKKIYLALIAGFRGKKIALKETEANKQKLVNQKTMEIYVMGLVNNWLRRDNRLNGTLDSKTQS